MIRSSSVQNLPWNALVAVVLVTASLSIACEHAPDGPSMALDRVVLYRNGVGYFERTGTVDSDELRIRCRKDQVDDILKSLTVVDRSSGKALSVSMPLDPQSWANAALATLAPGSGNLASVLDSLRGTFVTLTSGDRVIDGRLLMVEPFETVRDGVATQDHRISVIESGDVEVAVLSSITDVTFRDGALALQLHRSLDASAGEGLFQQVDVVVRLSGGDTHDLMLGYVVQAPIWKPTYRVVLPTDPDSPALLQAWAVVDNTSGEDWTDVNLALTSGAPIAFAYDLHTPRNIRRPDMSSAGTSRRARVAIGETTWDDDGDDTATATSENEKKPGDLLGGVFGGPAGAATGVGRGGGGAGGSGYGAGLGGLGSRSSSTPSVSAARPTVSGSLDKNIIRRVIRQHLSEVRYCYEKELARDPSLRGKVNLRFTIGANGRVTVANADGGANGRVRNCIAAAARRWSFPKPKGGGIVTVSYPFLFNASGDANQPAADNAPMSEPEEPSEGFDAESLAASTSANARANRVAGLTQFDLVDRVTVPSNSSTMVAILNERIDAEQVFLFKPGGSGSGYENNPYRVVRFHNSTPFVLESGPIAIFAGGNFVGEGLSETIAAESKTTIPFAVEPSIAVTSRTESNRTDRRLLKIAKGILHVEWFQEHKTTWEVTGPKGDGYRVLVRHPRRRGYDLESPPDKTEELSDAYMVPIHVPANTRKVSVELVERTPTKTTMSIWDSSVPRLLDSLVTASNIDKATLERLRPIIKARRDIADIDQEIANLKKQQRELDHRANETRQNLEAIKKDPAAGGLRARLNKRLDEFTKEGDKAGRRIVELTSKRLEKKIELDESIESLTIEVEKN